MEDLDYMLRNNVEQIQISITIIMVYNCVLHNKIELCFESC